MCGSIAQILQIYLIIETKEKMGVMKGLFTTRKDSRQRGDYLLSYWIGFQ
jgi:hypothetical protein